MKVIYREGESHVLGSIGYCLTYIERQRGARYRLIKSSRGSLYSCNGGWGDKTSSMANEELKCTFISNYVGIKRNKKRDEDDDEAR